MQEYTRTEEQAQAEWEALNPAEGTILWYDKWFVENVADVSAIPGKPNYYRELMAWMDSYAQERAESGDTDEAWLDSLREQYQIAVDDIETSERYLAQEADLKNEEALEAEFQAQWEAEAKAQWEALKPEPDTTLWYEKWAAESLRYQGKRDSGRYYCNLMATLAEFQAEREAFSDDDGYLSCIRDEYEATRSDIAKWDADSAAEKLALEGGLDLSGTGHIIGVFFTGCYDS